MNTNKQFPKSMAWDVVNQVSFDYLEGGQVTAPWGNHKVWHFEVTLRRFDFEMTVNFYQGLALTECPSDFAVLDSLLQDATTINDFKGDNLDGFFSWCDEYGDTPSRELYEVYKTIHENTENLVKLFGGQAGFELVWDWFNSDYYEWLTTTEGNN